MPNAINGIAYIDISFKKGFEKNVFLVSAIGRDSAYDGALYQSSAEGSEFSYGVRSQDKNGVKLLASRVSGSNPYGTEQAGVIIYAIGM